VALPHGAPEVGRNAAPVRGGTALAWPIGGGELGALELWNERVQRALEQVSDVPVRNLVPEQRLRVAQLVVDPLVQGDLEGEPSRRGRCDRRCWRSRNSARHSSRQEINWFRNQ